MSKQLFSQKFEITRLILNALMKIERAGGFLDALES